MRSVPRKIAAERKIKKTEPVSSLTCTPELLPTLENWWGNEIKKAHIIHHH
jgi:hypothetical protein